jgi:hypothetical protein
VIKNHPFFGFVDWAALSRKGYACPHPPGAPQEAGDSRYFRKHDAADQEVVVEDLQYAKFIPGF